MGTSPWLADQSQDHEPCHQRGRLDAKKKSLGATERREEERAKWREQMRRLDANRLVFLDECGSNIALTPLYARAPRGQRATDYVPGNRGKNTTLMAALSLEGIGASMIIEGAANGAALKPTLNMCWSQACRRARSW